MSNDALTLSMPHGGWRADPFPASAREGIATQSNLNFPAMFAAFPEWVEVSLWTSIGLVVLYFAWVLFWAVVPRQSAWFGLSFGYVLLSVWTIITWLVFENLSMHGKPTTCMPGECHDVLSCRGLSSLTLDAKNLYVIIGGLAAAYNLWTGALFHKAGSMNIFYGIMVGWLGTYVVAFLFDLAYIAECEAYPQSVIALLFEVPGDFPISYRQKQLIQTLNYYPVDTVDLVTKVNGTSVYIAAMIMIVAFIAGITYQARVQVFLNEHGPALLGPVFSMKEWYSEVGFDEGDRLAIRNRSGGGYGGV
mmetsp:Transcript_11190/g.24680  ORF Transcript_11190/g.24680 Transcript_11190/m.24680 type:complete len:305 (-) Transcript_11190:56-970(-)